MRSLARASQLLVLAIARSVEMAAAPQASVAALAPPFSIAASFRLAPAWLDLMVDGNILLMLDVPKANVPSPALVDGMVRSYKGGSNAFKLGLIAFLASMWPQLWTEARFQMAMEVKTIQGRIHLADMQLDFHQDEMKQLPKGPMRREGLMWLRGVRKEQLKDKTSLKVYSGTFREVSKAQAEERAQAEQRTQRFRIAVALAR
jgi:hypothetical protein